MTVTRRRWFTLGLLAVLLAGGFAGFTVWQGWKAESVEPLPGIAYSLGVCHTYPEPVGAAGYNSIAASVSDPLIVGGDVAASTDIGDGRHVWMFGDTSRDLGGQLVPAARNTMLLVGNGCRAVVVAPAGGAVIPDRADGVGYWPMSLVASHADGVTTLTVSAQRVRGEEKAFQFTNLGPALATFLIPDGGAPRFVSVVDLGPDSKSRRTVGWGAAMAVEGDMAYIYGTSNPEEPLVFGFAVRVARVPLRSISDVAAWRYWTGTAWTDDEASATEVIDAVGGVSQTFSVFHRGSSWYALSKRDGYLGNALALWPASEPWGTFGDPVIVGLIPNSADERTILRYMPLAHPELISTSPDAVIVSVSRNSEDFDLLKRFPTLYRPYFVEVPIPPAPSDQALNGPEAG